MTLLFSLSRRVVRPALFALCGVCAAPAFTYAQNGLDPLLQGKAHELTGRSRVIVEFRDAIDTRAISQKGAVAGRRLNANQQVADVDNTALDTLAGDPRV